jgi:hypothetical protein
MVSVQFIAIQTSRDSSPGQAQTRGNPVAGDALPVLPLVFSEVENLERLAALNFEQPPKTSSKTCLTA